MARRGRRSGMGFIEDDSDRRLTFFKRRNGIFKAASELSTLTGARIAVVLESENESFSSFGTPDSSPIVDAFLSGNTQIGFDTSEEQKAKITDLQNELFKLEKDKAMEDKRNKENIAWTKKIQETSRMAKYVYGKEEDLDATELYEMYRELSRIKKEVNDRLPIQLHDNQVKAGGQLRDPSLLQPTWWHSMPSHVVVPMKNCPWATSKQPSFQHDPWSSSSHQELARSSSFVPCPMMLPPQQVESKPQQHPFAPYAPSMLRLQAPLHKEGYPYNNHIRGLDISGNISHPFLLSPISRSPPPQPSSLQTPPSNDSSPLSLSLKLSSSKHLKSKEHPFKAHDYNSLQPPQSSKNVDSTLDGSHHLFFDSSYGVNIELGNTYGNGGQTSGGHNKGFGLSPPQNGDGRPGVMPESSSDGQTSNGGDAKSNICDLNIPWSEPV